MEPKPEVPLLCLLGHFIEGLLLLLVLDSDLLQKVLGRLSHEVSATSFYRVDGCPSPCPFGFLVAEDHSFLIGFRTMPVQLDLVPPDVKSQSDALFFCL